MKAIKYFAIALATLSLSACSDDNNAEDYDSFLGAVNTASGVTVEMDPTFTINENVSIFKVPVKVNGTTNGKVVVTVGVTAGPSSEANETEDAVEGVNYVLTSATINIPEGSDVGYFECTNVWEQGVINYDRVFTMTITDVKGATIGSQKDCVVTIANIDDAYTMMLGTWKFTGYNVFEGETEEYTMTMTALESDDPDYGSRFECFGFYGSYVFMPLSFDYDVDTETITVKVLSGEFASWYTWTVSSTSCIMITNTSTSKTGFGADEETVATFNSIKPVNENAYFMIDFMPYPAMNSILGYYDGWTNYELSR